MEWQATGFHGEFAFGVVAIGTDGESAKCRAQLAGGNHDRFAVFVEDIYICLLFTGCSKVLRQGLLAVDLFQDVRLDPHQIQFIVGLPLHGSRAGHQTVDHQGYDGSDADGDKHRNDYVAPLFLTLRKQLQALHTLSPFFQ